MWWFLQGLTVPFLLTCILRVSLGLIGAPGSHIYVMPRDDISPYGQNVGKQLELMPSAMPYILKFEGGKGYATAVGGHVQGMARINNGWVTSSTMDMGQDDKKKGYLLGHASTTSLKDAKTIPIYDGHVYGVAAAGNVAAVLYPRGSAGKGGNIINFFDFSSGKAVELPHLTIQLPHDNRIKGPMGLTYIPTRKTYVLIIATSKYYFRTWTFTRESLLTDLCNPNACWMMESFGSNAAREFSLINVMNVQESASLIYDVVERVLYWFVFGRDGEHNVYEYCKLNAWNYSVIGCKFQRLDNNLSPDRGYIFLRFGAKVNKVWDPSPNWRWGGTAFTDTNGQLYFAASERNQQRIGHLSTQYSWVIGLWSGSEEGGGGLDLFANSSWRAVLALPSRFLLLAVVAIHCFGMTLMWL